MIGLKLDSEMKCVCVCAPMCTHLHGNDDLVLTLVVKVRLL